MVVTVFVKKSRLKFYDPKGVIQTNETICRKKKAIKTCLMYLYVDIFKYLEVNIFISIDNINKSQAKYKVMTNKVNMDNRTRVLSNWWEIN